MRYYIYISDRKLEMLYPQIPRSKLKNLAAKIKIDLKVFSLSLENKKARESTRYAMLELVSNYIMSHLDVGTVDHPKEYIHDSLLMRWGSYSSVYTDITETGVVYFGATTKSTVFGMAGSINHLIGAQGKSKVSGASESRFLLAYLYKQEAIEPSARLKKLWSLAGPENEHAWESAASSAVRKATARMEGPSERLEFLARTLLTLHDSGESVVLATPIFVART